MKNKEELKQIRLDISRYNNEKMQQAYLDVFRYQNKKMQQFYDAKMKQMFSD